MRLLSVLLMKWYNGQLLTVQPIFISNPTRKPCKSDIVLMANWFRFACRIICAVFRMRSFPGSKSWPGINISEKRRPQGGRITFTHGQSDLDIRVSTLPTLYGESISLRLLNEKSQPLSMQELALFPAKRKSWWPFWKSPMGLS